MLAKHIAAYAARIDWQMLGDQRLQSRGVNRSARSDDSFTRQSGALPDDMGDDIDRIRRCKKHPVEAAGHNARDELTVQLKGAVEQSQSIIAVLRIAARTQHNNVDITAVGAGAGVYFGPRIGEVHAV